MPTLGARSGRRYGFTLIELLVVVGIIGLLAGMLLVMLGQVRMAGRKQVCSSNLRQIGMAVLAYADQNDGNFPQYNNLDCYGWPYIFGDWGTGYWGRYTTFYVDYLPAPRSVYFCPEARIWQAGTSSEFEDSWKTFPAKPAANWIVDIGYCYFAGSNESKTNLRGGPRGVWDATPRSTLLADVMKFGAAPGYAPSPSTWNHQGGVATATLTGRNGGNLFYFDGHVAWMSDPAELMRHRQKINGNDNRSYVAEQKNDP